MTARPLLPLPDAPILTRADVDHRVRWTPGERLHQLFEQRCDQLQAEGRVAQLAVDSPSARLRYAELDQLANRLARQLRAEGRGPGDVIGLLFDKSAWSYAAMLAVGKIHAAYVPLDAGFPAERIAYIVGDAGVCQVLSTEGYRALLAEVGAPVLCVDTLGEALTARSGARLEAAETGPPAGELCYVIYTSGSTGRPKGVPIDHGQIVNFVRVAAELYGYRADDRVYQGLTLAFDFAVEEIWVPLVVGATLLPNQTGASLLGADLADFLRTQRATALCCVPTLLATLDEELPGLRLLIVSGEACPRDLVTRWHRPGRRFLNAYGPTEATVTATLGEPRPGEPVTIGRPLPTYAIVILAPDEARALPFGAEGEIGIAGIGIARGYLNRDDQTRKAFIPDFLGIAHNDSGRIYRTGDLGRINARGEVEYLGRIDTQVKIRGYRIELAEIESLLLQVPQIAQAVVNTWEAGPGVVELAAYYTQHPGSEPLAGDALAQRLRTALPSYMVPAFYERLDTMPMLASDKADRQSLPPPAGRRLQPAARAFVAAEGPLEPVIAEELAALLQLERVSVEDHFFDDLGANSLLMAQFSARLRRRLGSEALAMREIYGHPSVRRLAAHLAQAPAPTPTAAAAATPRPAHQASPAAYWGCGAAQALLAFLFLWAHAQAWWSGYHLVIEAPGWRAAGLRALGFSAAYFAAATLLPIGLKWLLVGRWRATEFPVWSARYLRFWVLKSLVRTNPMVMFAGTPLYVLYLRLLGARVAWSAQVGLRLPPTCTDLLTIGERAVIGSHALIPGYRAEGGRIRIGAITLGPEVQVGEGALVDIDTGMGRASRLAHASSLHAGQRVPDGQCVHGSPAQPAPDHPPPPGEAALEAAAPVTALRRTVFSLYLLASTVLIYLPLPLLAAHAVFGDDGHALDRVTHAAGPTALGEQAEAALQSLQAGEDALVTMGLARLLALTWGSYLGALVLGLLATIVLPRLLARWLVPGRVYPLCGLHDLLHRHVRTLGNVQLYHTLFGDSSYIVAYLRALGYRFRHLVQTGSNFGLGQQHDVPTLCDIGSGTMVSDGLVMLNADYSAQAFRVREVRIGARNFLGNKLLFPAGHRVGDNVLLGSKTMLPLDGPLRQDVGLLGSPPFEIPRSVRRDAQFDHYKDPAVLAERLRLKNRSNLLTMAAFVVSNGLVLSALALLWRWGYPLFSDHGGLFLAAYALASMPLTLACFIAIDALSRGLKPLQPQYCSIYDDCFWRHERHWKLGLSNDQPLLAALSGTPFKGLVWRALGVRVGRQLFDDGAAIPEKTLVSLGDHCTLGQLVTLQSHSLEDGSFKSDRIEIGHGCTIGANTYVHYGTTVGDGAAVAPDAFVMKGEQLGPGSAWRGNPARPGGAQSVG